MSERFRSGNPPTGVLAAPALASDLTISVPSGTYTSMGRPSQVFMGQALEKLLVTFVQTGSPEVWTVTRGYDGTAPTAADAGDSIERIYLTDEVVYHPGGTTLTLGTSYTPDAGIKYHFLTTGSSNVTINPPTKTGGAQVGDELRFLIFQGNVARSVTFSTAAGGYNVNGFSVTGTKNTLSSVSFAFNGATWLRQQ